MDNEWNYNEELEPLPEHTMDPEFTPEYPDVTFFKESYVTMREENIFQGEPPQGETQQKTQNRQKAKQTRMSWFRKFLGSAMRGGAAIVAAATLVTSAASGDSSAAGHRIRNMMKGLREEAFEQPSDYSPEELNALWNSDPQAPHQYDYDHLVVIREATCTHPGESCYICTDCGVRLIIPTTKAHEPAAPVRENTVKPDCVHDGSCEEVVLCEVCGKELSRTPVVLAALGHTEQDAVIENVTEPSCTEEGSEEEVIYCAVCGEELSRTTVVLEALGHTEGEPVTENETEPGCTEEGSQDEVVYCAVCGEELSRTTVVLEALGHTEDDPVTENVVNAGCTAEGSRDEVIYCAVCGEELSRTTETTPALGHSYTAAVTAPTCTAQGYTTHTCSRCGNSYQDTYTAALGHSYTNKVTAATCTAQGYTTHTCSRCGNSYRDTYTAALGHIFNIQTWNWEGPTSDPTGSRIPVLSCTRCSTPAFTISFVNAKTINYTMNEDFFNQAKTVLGHLEWGDCVAYEDSAHTYGIGYFDGDDEAKTSSGTIKLDFTPVSGTTYYYKICLRVATSGSSDDICFVAPQGGGSRTYKQP